MSSKTIKKIYKTLDCIKNKKTILSYTILALYTQLLFFPNTTVAKDVEKTKYTITRNNTISSYTNQDIILQNKPINYGNQNTTLTYMKEEIYVPLYTMQTFMDSSSNTYRYSNIIMDSFIQNDIIANNNTINDSIANTIISSDKKDILNTAILSSNNDTIRINSISNNVVIKNDTIKSDLHIKQSQNNISIENSLLEHKFIIDLGENTINIGNTLIKDDMHINKGSNSITMYDFVSLNGKLYIGDGNNTLSMSNTSVKGDLKIGKGNNSISMYDSVSLNGKLSIGDGNNTISMSHTSVKGDFNIGKGNNSISMYDSVSLNGKLSIGDGHNTVSMSHIVVKEDVTIGKGNNIITIYDCVLSNGKLSIGNGNNTLTTKNSSVVGGIYVGLGDHSIQLDNTRIEDRVQIGDGNSSITIANSFLHSMNSKNRDNGDNDNDDQEKNSGIFVGSGNNTLHITDSIIQGDTSLNTGNKLIVIANSTIDHNVNIGNGINTLSFTNTNINNAVLIGNGTHTILFDTVSVTNNVSIGIGDHVINIKNSVFNDFDIDKGNASLTLYNTTIYNDTRMQEGNKVINIASSTLHTLSLGNGIHTLLMTDNTKTGNIILGSGVYDVTIHSSLVSDLNFSNATQMKVSLEDATVQGLLQGGIESTIITALGSSINSISLTSNNNSLGLYQSSVAGDVNFTKGDNFVYIQESTIQGNINITGVGKNTVNIIDSIIDDIDLWNSELTANITGSTAGLLYISGVSSNVAILNSTLQEIYLPSMNTKSSITNSTIQGNVTALSGVSIETDNNTFINGNIELIGIDNTVNLTHSKITGNINIDSDTNKINLYYSTLSSPLYYKGKNNTVSLYSSVVDTIHFENDNNILYMNNTALEGGVFSTVGNNNRITIEDSYLSTGISFSGNTTYLNMMNSFIESDVRLGGGINTVGIENTEISGSLYVQEGFVSLIANGLTLTESLYTGTASTKLSLSNSTIQQNITLSGISNNIALNNTNVFGILSTRGINDTIFINNSFIEAIYSNAGNNSIEIFSSIVANLDITRGDNTVVINNSIVKAEIGNNSDNNKIHLDNSILFGDINVHSIDINNKIELQSNNQSPITRTIQAQYITKNENAFLYNNPKKTNDRLIINGSYTTKNTKAHSFAVDVDFISGESDYIIFNGTIASNGIKVLPISMSSIQKDSITKESLDNIVSINSPSTLSIRSSTGVIDSFPIIIGGTVYEFVETSPGLYSLVKSRTADSNTTFSLYSKNNMHHAVSVWNNNIKRVTKTLLKDSYLTLQSNNAEERISEFITLWIDIEGGYSTFKKDNFLSSEESNIMGSIGVSLLSPIESLFNIGVDIFVNYTEGFITLRHPETKIKDSTGTVSTLTAGVSFSIIQNNNSKYSLFGTLTAFTDLMHNKIGYKHRVTDSKDMWDTYSINTTLNFGVKITEQNWIIIPQIGILYTYFSGNTFLASDHSIIDIKQSDTLLSQANILVGYNTTLGLQPYMRIGLEQPIYNNSKGIQVANITNKYEYISYQTSGTVGLGLQYTKTINGVIIQTGFDINSKYSKSEIGVEGSVDLGINF